MDSGENKIKSSYNPRKSANIFSILFFYWVNPLLYKGSKKELEQSDLYEALEDDHSGVLGTKLEEAWHAELEKYRNDKMKDIDDKTSKAQKPSLRNVLIRTFGSSLIPLGMICFFEECVIRLLQPWFMGQFMGYFEYNENNKVSNLMAWLYAGGVVLMTGCYCITHHQFFFGSQMVGMRLRVATGSLIYRKALKLSHSSVAKCTSGKIVNLLANDVNRFDLSVMFFHYLWVAPLQFVIVIYLTWQRLGEVTLSGAAIILIFVPIQGWLSKQFYRLRGKTAKKTDERINLMNEIINGIKVIKMYAWESSFAKLIAKARREEINVIRQTCYFRTFNMASFMIFVRLALALILVVWVLGQNIVTPEIAFLTLSWYNITRLSLVMFVPNAFTFLAEALKSIKRIEDFLLLEEFSETRSVRFKIPTMNGVSDEKPEESECDISNGIIAKDVHAKWNPEDLSDSITRICFKINKGQCFGICGSVGDGKSSFLQTLLSELPMYSGKIDIFGKIGFASQDPWIFDGTIKQNILFGREFDPGRYNETIRLCCMEYDLSTFENGSDEIVGDRGTNLSGGQKARLNLARAIYGDSDIYLLDDPLSAVDANVGKVLFESCIRGSLKEKAVILVTHQLHFLKHVDKIVVLEKGEMVEFGAYSELMSNTSGRLYMLLEERKEQSDISSFDDGSGSNTTVSVKSDNQKSMLAFNQNMTLREKAVCYDNDRSRQNTLETSSLGSIGALNTIQDESEAPLASQEDLNDANEEPDDLTELYFDDTNDANKSLLHHRNSKNNISVVLKQPKQENINQTKSNGNISNMALRNDKSTKKNVATADHLDKGTPKVGSVSIKLYSRYIHAGASIFGILVLVTSTLMSHGLLRFADAWLGVWTSNERLNLMQNLSSLIHNNNNHSIPASNEMDQLIEEFNTINYFYLIVFGSTVIGIIISTYLMIYRFFVTCITASKNLHDQMFSRILRAPSRFFDVNPKGRILNRFSKDIGCMDDILPPVFSDVFQIMLSIVGIIVLLLYKLWWMIVPTFIVAIIFYFVRKYYLKSSVAIKRIEGVSKAPIFSQLSSSLNGLSTIRCCGTQRKLINEFDSLQDTHTSAWYCFIATSRCLGVYCDWIVFFFLSLCTFPFIVIGQDNVGGADVGLVISTAIALTGMLQYGMRQSAELENLMTSVERVSEYGEIKTEEESESNMMLSLDAVHCVESDEVNWPTDGIIEFKQVSLRYGEDGKFVLRNVNFKTGKEEKIGIVGRTGAGKSSLIAALYRLTEPEGDILIDGHSIKKKRLVDLRTSISIIPQDPVLFTGTLRMNLDPFDGFSDEEIWNSLNLANLTSFVSNLPQGLKYEITEGGDNLSIGQRQLMCLARALLRKTKILVLDEATANVDLETDDLIQKTIRQEFSHCTVMTIAHRLNTIADYDKVLVLNQGEVVEYDSPSMLMSSKSSLFYSMCIDAGLL